MIMIMPIGKRVLELYDQGKSTRDIAKEIRMSLRDISSILRKNQTSHGIAITNDNGNSDNNNNSSNDHFNNIYYLP
jgi:orotate phosphoribosyltransferase-like protein